jgi:hypothetical protein
MRFVDISPAYLLITETNNPVHVDSFEYQFTRRMTVKRVRGVAEAWRPRDLVNMYRN